MRRTIHATAVGAAMMCAALSAPLVAASDGDVGANLGDAEPSLDVESRLLSDATPAGAGNELPPFLWTTDLSLAPPPYLRAPTDAHVAPPSATAPAIPLPPAAWTGFASLAGLGVIAYLRRLRRSR